MATASSHFCSTMKSPCFIRIFIALLQLDASCSWISMRPSFHPRRPARDSFALSSDFLENDLVAIREDDAMAPRLCAVSQDGTALPLCIRQDDVENDLFVDPRAYTTTFWQDATDEQVVERFGEGFYGQRPVPSLGEYEAFPESGVDCSSN